MVEHARIYALPEANPAVLACYAQELERQGMARRAADDATAFTADHANGNTPGWQVPDDATAFTADHANVPAGCALPPTVTRGLPKIVGLPKDLLLIPPELCIGHVRFWMPQDALDVAHRALDRCRHSLADPRLRTWVYFEIMLVHFIQSQDTPQAREIERRNQIVARDGFGCLTTGCMSRCNLHGHHLEHRGQQGSDDWWNQASNCAGHHGPCLHKGINEMGGFAPDRLTIRLGIHPKTGRAFAAYRNERRVSDEVAKADITRWRLWWKARHRQMRNRTAPEVVPAAAAIA